jgi:hypothetical protein
MTRAVGKTKSEPFAQRPVHFVGGSVSVFEKARAMEVIEFFCRRCGKPIKVDAALAGKTWVCPACTATFTVPTPKKDAHIAAQKWWRRVRSQNLQEKRGALIFASVVGVGIVLIPIVLLSTCESSERSGALRIVQPLHKNATQTPQQGQRYIQPEAENQHANHRNAMPAQSDSAMSADSAPRSLPPDARTATYNNIILLGLCATGAPEQVAAAIKSGADLKAMDKDGMTPLMLAAAYNSNPDVISALLKAGADVIAKDEIGRTALICAARYNSNSDVITALLNAGADVNAKNRNDWTALMSAARYNSNSNVIAALLKAGADVTAKNKDGRRALDIARACNNGPAVAALLKAGAQGK